MSDNIDRVLDRILVDLSSLVAAESEAAVQALHTKIEDAIEVAAKELKSTSFPSTAESEERFEKQRSTRKAR